MSEFTNTEAYFDPLEVSLDDINFDYVEDPITGATSYSDEPIEEEEDWTPEPDEPKPIDVSSVWASLDDSAELDFGDSKLTKGTVLELAQKRSEIELEHGYVSELASNLKQSEKHLEFIKRRSLSEVDKHIAAIDQILRDPSISDAERGQRHRQRQQLEARQSELNAEFTRGEQIIHAQKQELLGARIKETDDAMIRRYGAEWKKSAKDVYNFVINQGVSPDVIAEGLSPAMADIFVMARKYAALESQRKAKVRQEVEATVARSKKAVQTSQRMEPIDDSRKSAFRQKMNTSKLSKDDLAAGFDFIEW